MKLQPLLMSKLHHDGQRIVAGILSLCPAHNVTPRNMIGLVKRIAKGTHMDNQGVHPILLRA